MKLITFIAYVNKGLIIYFIYTKTGVFQGVFESQQRYSFINIVKTRCWSENKRAATTFNLLHTMLPPVIGGKLP